MSETGRAQFPHEQDTYLHRRNIADILRNRLTLLKGRDRLIMRMYYENGVSATRIAVLMGVSTSTISRRIKTLSTRLVGCKYQSCTRNRHRLSADELEIARDHFVRGMSLRAIASERDSSFYRIRKIVRKIKLITNSSGRDAAPKPHVGASENAA